MALSIIEFAVLGLLGYGAIAVLMCSLVIESPSGRSFAISRILLIVPGIWALWFLASLGPQVYLDEDGNEHCIHDDAPERCVPTIILSITTTEDIAMVVDTRADNTTTTVPVPYEVKEVEAVYLQSEVWWMWHWVLGIVLFIFVLVFALQLVARPA